MEINYIRNFITTKLYIYQNSSLPAYVRTQEKMANIVDLGLHCFHRIYGIFPRKHMNAIKITQHFFYTCINIKVPNLVRKTHVFVFNFLSIANPKA